jgi:hypothetical protein
MIPMTNCFGEHNVLVRPKRHRKWSEAKGTYRRFSRTRHEDEQKKEPDRIMTDVVATTEPSLAERERRAQRAMGAIESEVRRLFGWSRRWHDR